MLKPVSYMPPQPLTLQGIQEFYSDPFTNMGSANGLREAQIVKFLLAEIEGQREVLEQVREWAWIKHEYPSVRTEHGYVMAQMEIQNMLNATENADG